MPRDYPVDHARVYMCALDFIRAMNERPWWARVLCRVLFGKYAYREFTFLVRNIESDGYNPFSDYGLEQCGYHTEPQPWKWWLPR